MIVGCNAIPPERNDKVISLYVQLGCDEARSSQASLFRRIDQYASKCKN